MPEQTISRTTPAETLSRVRFNLFIAPPLGSLERPDPPAACLERRSKGLWGWEPYGYGRATVWRRKLAPQSPTFGARAGSWRDRRPRQRPGASMTMEEFEPL